MGSIAMRLIAAALCPLLLPLLLPLRSCASFLLPRSNRLKRDVSHRCPRRHPLLSRLLFSLPLPLSLLLTLLLLALLTLLTLLTTTWLLRREPEL
jgi:hypothetical protein